MLKLDLINKIADI